jgi:hypothetical protein
MTSPSAYKFLIGEKAEHPDGYTADEIANFWINHDLEEIHNYIQWAFPLKDPSNFSIGAPILSEREVNKIKKSATAQQALEALMWRMIDFYDQTTHWLIPYDHNHLRITRIIKSLGLLMPPQYGLTFYHFIMWKVCASSKPCLVNPQSINIWRAAAFEIGYPGAVVSKEIKTVVEETLGNEATFRAIDEQRHGVPQQHQPCVPTVDPHVNVEVDKVIYLQAIAQERSRGV